MGGIKLGRVLGFDISIDWSWLLIFFLVVFTLASGYYPLNHPEFSVTLDWELAVISALLLFAAVLIHELSHSLVSRQYGTPVRGITLFLFGGVSQISDEPHSAREEFWMAIAGPLTSIGLGIIFYFLSGAGTLFGWPQPVLAVVGYLAMINIMLGVFNLIPGFPLDGGRVLRSIIWGITDNLDNATRWASYMGQGFGYLLMAFGFALVLAGQLVGGLWMIFIGWFLTGAARSSYQQLMIREALSGVRVDR